MKKRKKNNSISQEEFFRNVSLNSGVADLRTIKDIYFGLVRTITREMRDRRVVDLPEFGKFELLIYKEKMFRNINTGVWEPLPLRPVAKFTSNHNLQKYFQEIMNLSTVL
jgi:nucleoid DNA-binding protein